MLPENHFQTWEDLLAKAGFELLESTCKIYSNGAIRGRLAKFNPDGKRQNLVNTDKDYSKVAYHFCPFSEIDYLKERLTMGEFKRTYINSKL